MASPQLANGPANGSGEKAHVPAAPVTFRDLATKTLRGLSAIWQLWTLTSLRNWGCNPSAKLAGCSRLAISAATLAASSTSVGLWVANLRTSHVSSASQPGQRSSPLALVRTIAHYSALLPLPVQMSLPLALGVLTLQKRCAFS